MNNAGVALLSAPAQILANNGTITITDTGHERRGGRAGLMVASGIPCGNTLDAGPGGTVTINQP